MGSRSNSSSSSTSVTTQEDNRIAATDNAVAVGRGGRYSVDASTTYADSPITINSSTSNQSVDADVAESYSRALEAGLREAGETSRAAINSNTQVSRQGLDLAGAVADDGFDITRSVVDILAQTAQEVVSTVNEAARGNANQSYEFAGRVLDGYETARLDEGERKFNQVMTAVIALGVVGAIAWAYVKGR